MLTRGPDFKMAASIREKMYCVLEHAKTSSLTVVQRHIRTKFAKEAILFNIYFISLKRNARKRRSGIRITRAEADCRA
jgi:hypothetical protein